MQRRKHEFLSLPYLSTFSQIDYSPLLTILLPHKKRVVGPVCASECFSVQLINVVQTNGGFRLVPANYYLETDVRSGIKIVGLTVVQVTEKYFRYEKRCVAGLRNVDASFAFLVLTSL